MPAVGADGHEVFSNVIADVVKCKHGCFVAPSQVHELNALHALQEQGVVGCGDDGLWHFDSCRP